MDVFNIIMSTISVIILIIILFLVVRIYVGGTTFQYEMEKLKTSLNEKLGIKDGENAAGAARTVADAVAAQGWFKTDSKKRKSGKRRVIRPGKPGMSEPRI